MDEKNLSVLRAGDAPFVGTLLLGQRAVIDEAAEGCSRVITQDDVLFIILFRLNKLNDQAMLTL